MSSAGPEADILGVIGGKVCIDLCKPVIDGCCRSKAAGDNQAGEEGGVQRLSAASTTNATVNSVPVRITVVKYFCTNVAVLCQLILCPLILSK